MNFWGKNKQLPKNATSPEITEFLINHNTCMLPCIGLKMSSEQIKQFFRFSKVNLRVQKRTLSNIKIRFQFVYEKRYFFIVSKCQNFKVTIKMFWHKYDNRDKIARPRFTREVWYFPLIKLQLYVDFDILIHFPI